jgi:hypothetical protein
MSLSPRFEPDPWRAHLLDKEMRVRLADSLVHIVERSRGVVPLDESVLLRLVAKLRHQRFPPLIFALYYDIVDAIHQDRLVDAESILVELGRQNPIADKLRIAALDSTVMGCSTVERYCRMMDTDANSRYRYSAPPVEIVCNFGEQCKEATALMARAAPELHGEFSNLVSEIVLATGESNEGTGFAGASSFLLWGALFINPEGDQPLISLIETFAHESAHSLLFGLMLKDSFVLNADRERFKSPLRKDPRPMDGIFHATFVIARMHYAMQRLIKSGLLNGEDIEVAKVSLEGHQKSFADGLATINRHGRLTNHGAAIMSSAAAYMARAA